MVMARLGFAEYCELESKLTMYKRAWCIMQFEHGVAGKRVTFLETLVRSGDLTRALTQRVLAFFCLQF
jgi:hypothetical protein